MSFGAWVPLARLLNFVIAFQKLNWAMEQIYAHDVVTCLVGVDLAALCKGLNLQKKTFDFQSINDVDSML